MTLLQRCKLCLSCSADVEVGDVLADVDMSQVQFLQGNKVLTIAWCKAMAMYIQGLP